MQHRRPRPLLWLGCLLSLLLAAPAHATKRTVVLVADLAASDVKASEAATISALLRGELARERKFILVQRGEMEEIAKEMEFQMSGCTDQGCAVQLGEMLNAEKVVVGRVAKLFGRLTISAEVVDMAANDIEFAEEVDCAEDYASVKAAIATLAKKLSGHVPVLAEVKGISGDIVVLDGGSREGLAPGQRLSVLRTVVVKDSQGRPLMEEKKVVGEVEITYANSRDSKARKVSGEIREGDYARVGTGVVAAVPAPTPAPARPAAAPVAPAPTPSPASRTTPLSTVTDPVTGMELVCIQGGTFEMGDTFGGGLDWEKPVHSVTVSDFCLGKFEVTQAQWQTVMGSNPSKFQGTDRPVEQVSWEDVQTFIQRLNQKSGKRYRLPTEAEWEYAARSGGKKEKWAGTSSEGDLERYAWYDQNSGGQTTHPVGQKRPNGLGLYDMSGNVWEWVQDWYGSYPSSAQRDPTGPSSGQDRVIRGGGWGNVAGRVRSADRSINSPGPRHYYLGFRQALVP